MNNCIDCRIEISKKAKRCLSCRGKSQQVKYLCQDCGCEVSRSGLKRCIDCEYKSRVGEGNSHFKDGYTLIDKKCMDCGKSICSIGISEPLSNIINSVGLPKTVFSNISL